MAPTDRMLHSDAFAWYMEKDPVLRSTVVAVNRLASEPDWQLLRLRIDRLSRLVPRLRMRVQAPPMRIGPPRWSIDEDFELDFHLRRVQLSEPAGWPEVLEFARTAAMADFDRSRPLWEFTLLEGLDGGGAAFVTKLHHSLTDGIGGMQLAALVVDPQPDPEQAVDLPPVPDGHSSSRVLLTVQSLADDAAEAATAVGQLVRAAPRDSVRAARHPMNAVRSTINTARSIGKFVAPINRPLSPMLGARRTGRLLATLDVSFPELHEAARAADGHLNDAFLAAMTDGMHRYHLRRGAPLDEVRVTMPVSIRGANDGIGGNRITLTRIKLPAGIEDPADRIRHIGAIVQQWRQEPALGHTQEIAFGLNLLPRVVLGGIFKRVEMLASNVPGVPRPVYLAGARITGYYAFGPTIGAGVNATLMTYADACNIGINIDTGAIDDPELYLSCLSDAFHDVLALAPARSRRHRSS